MAGRTGIEIVQVRDSQTTSIWRIIAGRGQVDVVSAPPLVATVDSVSIRGSSGNTAVRVTVNNSLAAAVAFPTIQNVRIQDHTFVEQALTGMNTTLDGTPAKTFSASFTSEDYLYFSLSGRATKNAVPTDLLFKVQFKSDTTWVTYRKDFWADLRFDDVLVGTGYPFAFDGKVIGKKIRAFVTGSGLSATNRFTLRDMTLTLKA